VPEPCDASAWKTRRGLNRCNAPAQESWHPRAFGDAPVPETWNAGKNIEYCFVKVNSEFNTNMFIS
jgi:hypothetical protein